MSTKFDSTYSAVVSMAEQMVGEGKYDSTYSAVLAIYQNLTSDVDTKFDSVYSIVVKIADGIESGEIDLGGGLEEQDFSPKIRFFDFDGNIVEQWTLDEAKTKTENDLPTLESIGFGSFNLDFDGWNTPLQDMHETTSDITVGSMWKPSDGNSWIKVNIEPENLTTVLLIEVLGDSVIDWGDGTTDDADTISGYPQHAYDSAGEKWIKIIGDWNPMWGSTQNVTEKYNNYPIGYYNNQITEIYLGRDTERYSFSYLKSLQYITFPNVQHTYTNQLSYFSFAWDGLLKNLYLPYGDGNMPTTSSSSGPFYQCYNLEVLSWRGWSQNVQIGAYYFYSLYNLRYTTIYHKVTSIGNNAFYQCSSLQSVTIPDNVTSIGSSVFKECYSLQSITIPDSVTSIGSDAFQNCASLKSITIPDSVTSIGQYVFQYCYSLHSVNILGGVTEIGQYVFQYCYQLHSVNILGGVTKIGDAMFINCHSLQSITIPDSVTSIGVMAFYGCKSLQSITIPDSVTSIGNNVFHYCYSLKSVNIPYGVTSIGSGAFNDCAYITVDFSDCTQVPTLSSTNAFDSTAIILVPSALYDEWISATNWSSLASQIIAV